MIHYLYREQILPMPVEKVWEYFCDPKNLNEIAPRQKKIVALFGEVK
jgi:ligand-binding SRPBCC domain-containing protein